MEDLPHPLQRIRHANARALIKEAGGGSAMARLLDSAKTHISAIENGRKPIGNKLAARMERAMHRPAGWLDQDHGANAGGSSLEPLDAYTVPPLIEAGELMKLAAAPDAFRMRLPDDALTPDHPRGVEFIWSARAKAGVGSIVLVRDGSGALHAREYRQGKAAAEWSAAPLNRAYAEFAGRDVELVAVAQYRAM